MTKLIMVKPIIIYIYIYIYIYNSMVKLTILKFIMVQLPMRKTN